MIETLLQSIGAFYPLTETDPGEYGKLTVNGMAFRIRPFHADGLGHVSVMTASGFFGLMKMDTLIINPTALDMPLLSYDRVRAMGNDTLIYELYDTLTGSVRLDSLDAAKQKSTGLPEHNLGSHWYDSIKLPQSLAKKGKKRHSPAFDTLTSAYLDAYLRCCANAPACDAAAKREKASVYVEGLLQNGGPSTDVFQKGIGGEKTAYLFRRILFGTRI